MQTVAGEELTEDQNPGRLGLRGHFTGSNLGRVAQSSSNLDPSRLQERRARVNSALDSSPLRSNLQLNADG